MREPVVRGSLPRTRWRLQALKVAKMHSAGSRMLQASGLCSPETECIATLGQDWVLPDRRLFFPIAKIPTPIAFAIPVTEMIFTAKLKWLGTSIIG